MEVLFQIGFLYRFFMDFGSPGHGIIKQNHDTVIKNQGFAEFLQNPFGDRFFFDFELLLEGFWVDFGRQGRFFQEKLRSKMLSNI